MTKFSQFINVATAASLLGLGCSAAHADNSFEDHFTFSGFGTLALTQTSTNDAQYVRDIQQYGATEHASFNNDSDLGLQLTGKVNSWLSGTIQVLSVERHDPNISTEVEWAFLKAQPVENLSIRIGRMELPMFAISDSRYVGYANSWVRPPNEVYGLALLQPLDGADVSYRMPIAGTSLTVTGLVGNSHAYFENLPNNIQEHDVHGANVLWETDWVSLRVGRVTSEANTSFLVPGQSDLYTFTGVGALMDHNNIVAQAEWVKRTSENYGPYVNAEGWYVLGGYRFGKVLPYASVAAVGDTAHQSTVALGVRWDAFKSAAVKFQFDRVDTKGTEGVSFAQAIPTFGMDKVYVGTVAIDFVF
jgi:hypothetical protein